MKGIITLLIFICFFHGGIVAQQKTPKSTMKKKEERTPAKKILIKKDAAPQKQHKPQVEKNKEVVAAVQAKEEIQPAPADSEVAPENTAVANDIQSTGPRQHEDPVVIPSGRVPTSTTTVESMSDWQSWISWLSLGLIVGMGMYVFRTNGNIRDRLWKIQKHLDAQKANLQWEKAKYQAGINNTEVEHLINTSPTLKKIQEEYASLKSNMEKLQQPAPDVLPVTPAEDPPGGTFYMTGPTNNYFPSSARSNYRENTVYKFILQPGGNEARFELHTTGASISEIIKVVESYIKPACDEENLPSSGTRNIVTRKQGCAILENEKWIIKDKAVIRYE